MVKLRKHKHRGRTAAERDEAERHLRFATSWGHPKGAEVEPRGAVFPRVSFQRDRTSGRKLPAWWARAIRTARSEEALIEKMFERFRRAPSHENAVLLGVVVNELARRGRSGNRVFALARARLQRGPA